MRGSRSKIKKLLAVLLAVTVMTSSFDVKAVASAIGAAAGSTAAKVEDSMGADPEAGTEEQKTASGSSSEEGQEKEQTSLESGQEKEQETSGEAQEDGTESTEQVKEEDASEMIPEEGPEAPDKITDGAHPGDRPGAEDVTEEETEAVEADPETVPGTSLTEEIILKEHGNEIKETVSRNELVEERTEYSKKYRMEDGTYTSVVYSVPVHYEKAGEWKEINNTLLSCTADGETVYHNAAGSLIVSFPESMTGEEPVTVKKDGHTLSFRLEGEIKRSASAVKALQRSMAQVEDPDRAEAFREEGPSVGRTEQLRSRISYGNICEDTDLRYDLEGGRLKESLILKEYRDGLEGFRYVLDTGDMVPVLQDDGSIILYEKDSKKEVLFLAA